MPNVTILLPHLHTATDVRALRVALDTIARHTVHDYDLLVRAHHERSLYPVLNDMAQTARTDWLILTAADQFVSPGWDTSMWEAREERTLVVGGLVESGYQPVASQCLEINFGMSPETYQEAEFNIFAASKPGLPTVEAWCFPWLIHRERFLDLGGFVDVSHAADVLFFQKWQQAGNAWKRVQSYSYHLMCWSSTGDKR